MSTMMMNTEIIAQISEFIWQLNDFGFNNFGFSMPKSLQQCVGLDKSTSKTNSTIKTIFNRLYSLNALASDKEIRNNPDRIVEIPEMPKIETIVRHRQADRESDKVQPWHYAMAKYLDTYTYQLEGEGLEVIADLTEVRWIQALTDLKNTLFSYIVRNSKLYLDNGCIDYFDCYFYQVVEKEDGKYIVIDGYYYDEGEDNGKGTARCVQYSGVEYPLSVFCDKKTRPDADEIEVLAAENKQYIEDMPHNVALKDMQHFYAGVHITERLLSDAHEKMPCGHYVDCRKAV